MWRIAIKYALIGGFFESLLFHIGRSFGVHPMIDLRHLLFDIFILAIVISLSVYEYKKFQKGGFLHFWEGMTMGFFVYSISVAIFGLFLIVYFDTEMIIEYRHLALEMMNQQKEMYMEQLGQEVFDDQYNQVQTISKTRLLISALVKKLLVGFFVTPAISIVLRKKPN